MSSRKNNKSKISSSFDDESDFESNEDDELDSIEERRMAIARDFNDRLSKWYSIPRNVGYFFYAMGVAYFTLDFTKHLISNATQIIVASYC